MTMAGARVARRIAVEGVLIAGHKGHAVEVDFDPQAEWGVPPAALWPGRSGFPVEVQLAGVRFRSAIVPRMRRFFVLVDESLARRAGVRVGRPVTLTVWPDAAHEAGPRAPGGAGPKAAGAARMKRGDR